jgi:hypothetical protein
VGDPPQVPPTVAVYPAVGVTVNCFVAPWFTVTLPDGLMVPPVPAEAAMV